MKCLYCDRFKSLTFTKNRVADSRLWREIFRECMRKKDNRNEILKENIKSSVGELMLMWQEQKVHLLNAKNKKR